MSKETNSIMMRCSRGHDPLFEKLNKELNDFRERATVGMTEEEKKKFINQYHYSMTNLVRQVLMNNLDLIDAKKYFGQ